MHAIESPDAAERFIKTHVCAICGKALSVAWGGGFGMDSYIIRCAQDPKHEGMERTGGNVSTDIKKYEPAQALQVFEKRWGTLAPNQKDAEGAKLFDLVALGFDPILHLQLYQGRVTTTIDGMYWWASGHQKFERLTSEPITAHLKDAYGLGADDIGVIAKLYVKGLAEPYCTGFGKANMKTDRNPVSKDHPYRMAEKRAEAQAIRKLRPIGVQVYTPEDVVEGELVDTSTGEIQPPPAKAAVPAKPAPTPAAEPTRMDPSIGSIKNAGDLCYYVQQKHKTRTAKTTVEFILGKDVNTLATTDECQKAAAFVDAVVVALDKPLTHATEQEMIPAIKKAKSLPAEEQK